MSDRDRRRATVRGSTRLYGVIGWPVSGSLSPAIHNAAFAALGLDAVYVPFPVPPADLPAAIAGLRALGVAGANVTMPHKTEATALVEVLSEDARRLGAVNTIEVTASGSTGHNTDAPGFERFLLRDTGFEPAGARALLYGAGGAARACALALARAGLARLSVAVRDPARAVPLVEVVDGTGVAVEALPMGDEAAVAGLEVDLVVNATPLGAAGEIPPLPTLSERVLVVDLLYGSTTTPLLRAAREAGAAGFGGLGLLLHQAALSFQLWTGQEPPMPVMSAAALAQLGGDDAADGSREARRDPA